jgi:hypothetical protein
MISLLILKIIKGFKSHIAYIAYNSVCVRVECCGGRRHKIKISSLTAQINNNSVTLHFISSLIISTNANIKVFLRPESELLRQLKKKWSTQHRIMRAWRAGLQIKQEACVKAMRDAQLAPHQVLKASSAVAAAKSLMRGCCKQRT